MSLTGDSITPPPQPDFPTASSTASTTKHALRVGFVAAAVLFEINHEVLKGLRKSQVSMEPHSKIFGDSGSQLCFLKKRKKNQQCV